MTHMTNRQRIVDLVDRLGRMGHNLQFSGGLNPAQWETLRFLARANRYSRSPGALAEYLGTTKGTASQTVNALEVKGYLRRSPCPTDRRSVRLELTEAGKRLVESDPMLSVSRAADELSEAECEVLAEGIGRLVDSLRRAHDRRAFGLCGECSHNDMSDQGCEAATQCRCALTGELVVGDELDRICINFEPAGG